MRTIRVGIIGYGKRGNSHYLCYKKIKNVQVVAVCDISLKIKPLQDVRLYRNYRDLIANSDVDAVSICTPTRTHFTIAKICLNSGIQVLVEKPFTTSLVEAEQLITISKKNHTLCLIGYHLRYDPMIIQLEQLVKHGQIGRILMTRSRQAHNWGGERPFSWHIQRVVSGGGTIIDNATHYVDLMSHLVGPIKSVSAVANNLGFNSSVEDSAIVALQHTNGVISSIESSWADATGRNNQMILWGTKGMVEYLENNAKKILTITSYERHNKEWNRMHRDVLYKPKGIERVHSKINDLSFESSGLENLLRIFVQTVDSGKMAKWNQQLKRSSHTISVIEAAYKSLKSGSVIFIRK